MFLLSQFERATSTRVPPPVIPRISRRCALCRQPARCAGHCAAWNVEYLRTGVVSVAVSYRERTCACRSEIYVRHFRRLFCQAFYIPGVYILHKTCYSAQWASNIYGALYAASLRRSGGFVEKRARLGPAYLESWKIRIALYTFSLCGPYILSLCGTANKFL